MKRSKMISILGLSMVLLTPLANAGKLTVASLTSDEKKPQGKVAPLGLGQGFKIKKLPIEIQKPKITPLAKK